VPTAEQIKKGKKRGTIDYEGRPNRSDVYPKRAAKLADGGEVRFVDEFTNKDGIEISTGVSEDGKKFYMAHVTMYPLQRMIPMNEDKDAVMERAKKIHSDMEKHLAEEKMAKGGKTQGYDDKEDERLGMDGKLASKDFIGSRKHRKHSRRDDAQFEERGKMANGGMMKRGGRTKEAITADKRLKALKPGKRVSEDGNTYYESRQNRSDINRRDKLAKGGRVGHSKEDKARFAKPAGWRWKEIAVTKRIIERKQLSMQPSKKMRDKYPDYVYYEDRLNKADKKPSRKYLSE
jgi:hypothetical protein